ncbi:hypothetical protein [Peribacillus sp. SCS-155]|uniref:hypothetical protein n=1 Tax=Peribacillus sedimenti TaxID=3115297 RepID=UPI003905EA08
MGLFQTLFQRYSQQCETSEKHSDEQLLTRYYKATADQALSSLQEVFSNQRNYKIRSVSKEHGEMFIETLTSPKIFLVATCITVKPFETAVDFTASSDKKSIAGIYPALRKQISEAYGGLDQKLTTIGAGKRGRGIRP